MQNISVVSNWLKGWKQRPQQTDEFAATERRKSIDKALRVLVSIYGTVVDDNHRNRLVQYILDHGSPLDWADAITKGTNRDQKRILADAIINESHTRNQIRLLLVIKAVQIVLSADFGLGHEKECRLAAILQS